MLTWDEAGKLERVASFKFKDSGRSVRQRTSLASRGLVLTLFVGISEEGRPRRGFSYVMYG